MRGRPPASFEEQLEKAVKLFFFRQEFLKALVRIAPDDLLTPLRDDLYVAWVRATCLRVDESQLASATSDHSKWFEKTAKEQDARSTAGDGHLRPTVPVEHAISDFLDHCSLREEWIFDSILWSFSCWDEEDRSIPPKEERLWVSPRSIVPSTASWSPLPGAVLAPDEEWFSKFTRSTYAKTYPPGSVGRTIGQEWISLSHKYYELDAIPPILSGAAQAALSRFLKHPLWAEAIWTAHDEVESLRPQLMPRWGTHGVYVGSASGRPKPLEHLEWLVYSQVHNWKPTRIHNKYRPQTTNVYADNRGQKHFSTVRTALKTTATLIGVTLRDHRGRPAKEKSG